MSDETNYETQRIDHLGIVTGISREIGLVETIDQKVGENGRKVSCGEGTLAMIQNALGFSSWALYLMPDYMQNKPVDLLIRPGLEAEDQGVALGMAWGLWTSQVMDARIKNLGGPLSSKLGNWDHKPYILNNYAPNGFTTIGSRTYRFDIWSNIHYGYVGRAAGFPGGELTGGAGVEQIGSNFASGNPSALSLGADNLFAAYDDPSDNAAIQIGVNLWDQGGLNMTKADLFFAVILDERLFATP